MTSNTQEEEKSARVSLPSLESLNPDLRAVYSEIEKAIGRIPSLLLSLSHYPAIVRPIFEMEKVLNDQSHVDQKLIQIAQIRASVRNDAEYCLHAHMDMGRQAGLNYKQIDALRFNPRGGEFTEQEQLVIEYSDVLTRTSKVPDELFERMKKQFNSTQIEILTLTVSFINAFNRYTEALKLYPDH